MTLTFCSDLAAADWIVHTTLPWQQLVRFGPAGLDAYARLLLLPDPVRPGQSENDVEAEDWRTDQLPRLFELLAACTTTPDECYFCVWEGFANAGPVTDDDAAYAGVDNLEDQIGRAAARPGLAPTSGASPSVLQAPKVEVPHRAYWLFRGPLAEIGTWDTAEAWPGQCRLDAVEPAFVWPADHAWCVALDVDPHWAGIGGGALLVNQLIADPLLDVVSADPTMEQPLYW
ncbi:hypothetical protein [Micromonospora inositola]|uniref:DUF2716 domain-containing protein n=1 Tax=Micromonospora inositola TaxID=47865 RepID=A0A1C5JGS3_9ACTN|nr:hypothetical protein [Micromonospora inositola]SCG69683.1 hypothetical protein GA0070613_4648 [Micromonospora inositola]